MFEWLSDNRASIAAVIILILVAMLIWSISVGRKQSTLRAKDEVFGDPVRTRGGWYWAVCGVATLMLVWFYFSWGIGRAYFPNAANEMCQVAKLEAVVSPIKAALPIGSRYYKSTLLVARNTAQLVALQAELPSGAFSPPERTELGNLIGEVRRLIWTPPGGKVGLMLRDKQAAVLYPAYRCGALCPLALMGSADPRLISLVDFSPN